MSNPVVIEMPSNEVDRLAYWITWHDHARSKSIAKRLGIPIVLYGPHEGMRRHLGGSFWALRTLMGTRPHVVYTHYSYMLQICCAIYKSTSGNGQVTLITDCHNKALKRNLGGPAGYLYRRFKSWSLGCADLLIVSNELIVPIAECYNRRVTALRDPLPEWSAAATSVVEPDMFARATKPTCFTETLPAAYVLFICSFDADEPLELIFDSAKAIVDALSCSVYITGDKRRVTVPGTIESDTKIVFPGYLPLAEYVSMLRSAMVVVVLTEDSDCLVCGGYEGIAAGRPTVLSDTPALHACFGETALYSRHSVDEILQAVIAAAVECRSWETASALQVLQSAIDREWKCLLKAIDELMKRHG